MDIILYGDNTYKIYEGEIDNGVYEGYGIEYCPLIKDMIIYKGYFSNNYFIDINDFNDFNELIFESKPKLNILLLSKGDQPGKSTLISKITNTEYIDQTTLEVYYYFFVYEYDGNKYKIKIFDTPTRDRFIHMSLDKIQISSIIIYIIDLDKESLIKEEFIKDIRERKNDVDIYVVGNKLDKIEEKDITKQCLENIRNQASQLIKQNKINKYFETSGLTGEGIDNLLRHLKIDSSIFIDKIQKKKYDILKSEGKINKNNLNLKKNSNIKKKLKELEKLKKLNGLFKYLF